MDDNWKWLIVIIVLSLIIVGAYHIQNKKGPMPLQRRDIFMTFDDARIAIIKEIKKITRVSKEEVINTPQGYLIYNTEYRFLGSSLYSNSIVYTITTDNAKTFIKDKNNRKTINELCNELTKLSQDNIRLVLVDDNNTEHVLYISENGKKDYYYKDQHE